MIRKEWLEKIMFWIEVLIALGLTGLSLLFLYHYIEYGQEKREAAGQKQVEAERESDTEVADANRKESNSRTDILIPKDVHIRITNQDFRNEYHESVVLSCVNGYTVSDMETKILTEYGPKDRFEIFSSELADGKTLCVEGKKNGALALESISRGDGTPEYAGKLYLTGSEEGISVINELPLEEYLCGVVSSEMPSDYPEEALKAQAVCARTYAVNCSRTGMMNDSVSFQVYNNYRSQDASRKAVEATAGEILPLDEIQYFSTSCLSEHETGLDTNAAFEKFLSQKPEQKKEYGSAWLRWEAEIPVSLVMENLAGEFKKQGKEENGSFSVKVVSRRGDGQIQEVLFCCGEQTFLCRGEYQIRKLLGGRELEISLMDGTTVSGMELLPSAYFYTDGENYAYEGRILVRGGGYGHGNGMSQCGAAQMASEGLDYHAILGYYYGIDTIFGKET